MLRIRFEAVLGILRRSERHHRPKIVLTGGPGGGKTTLMRELRLADPRAERWILTPEAAPLLFQAGLNSCEPGFQTAVVQRETHLEDACAGAASDSATIVCHRGTLDALAYWLDRGWSQPAFFAATGLSQKKHLARYIGVIQLQTAAVGASCYYHTWPDAHRSENLEQAVRLDELCSLVWSQHPRYVFIGNDDRDWREKSRTAVAFLASLAR